MHVVPHSPRRLPHRSFSGVVRGLGLAALLAAGSLPCAFGQSASYHYVKIVDDETPRPDDPSGKTFFGFYPGVDSAPTLDGGKLVFRTDDSDSSIWVANVDGTGLTRLVDKNTAAPGGSGNFNDMSGGFYGNVPVLKDGTVVFDATSTLSGSDGDLHGIYSVPAAGGAVKRVADQNTVVPDGNGGTFFNPGSTTEHDGDFTVSAGRVAFLDEGGGTSGVYVANIDGSGLAAFADTNHPFSFTVNGNPNNQGSEFGGAAAIVSGTVAFHGQQSDPSTGYNALFTSTGSFAYDKIIDSATVLPGNADASAHTRFDPPPLAFDGTTLAFVADDANASPDFAGVYTLPAAGGALTKIIDTRSRPPGLDATETYDFADLALNDGLVAFHVSGRDHDEIYITKADGAGTIQRVAGTGDVLAGGQVVASIGLVCGGFSGGRVGVQVHYDLNHADGGDSGLYVLTPGAVVPVITSAAAASGATGAAFSYQITAANFATSYGVQGLPGGLTVNASTGLISGTPKNAGTYSLTLNAYNSAGKGSKTVTLTVAPSAPMITSAATVAGTTGKTFSYQITASGSPTSFGVQGLPGGLAVNSGTGLISGTPKVAGTYSLTLNAYNNAGKGSAPLTLTVALGAPTLTSPTTASGKVGTAFSYQIAATGSPTSYGVQGLPGGLTVNATTGLLSGTPAEGAAGTHALTLNAYNRAGKGSGTLTLTVTN